MPSDSTMNFGKHIFDELNAVQAWSHCPVFPSNAKGLEKMQIIGLFPYQISTLQKIFLVTNGKTLMICPLLRKKAQ